MPSGHNHKVSDGILFLIIFSSVSMFKGKHKTRTAMFDIRPVDDSGNIDVSRISSLQTILNLGRSFRITKHGGLVLAVKYPVFRNKAPNGKKIKSPIEEFENFLNNELDPKIELTSIGAEFIGEKYSKPRYRPIFAKQKLEMANNQLSTTARSRVVAVMAITKQKSNEESEEELDYEKILSEIKKPARGGEAFVGEPKKIDAFSLGLLTFKTPQENRASNELNMWVEDFSKKVSDLSIKKFKLPKISLPKIRISKPNRTRLLTGGIALVALVFFGHYGVNIKNQLIVEGNSAVANLENAGENIKNGDFVSASSNFSQAYQEFSKAGDDMNFMGAGISSLLSDLPGAGKFKSAKNLVEAGKLMADAGQAMSEAMSEVAKTNLILLPTSDVRGTSDVKALSIGSISISLNKALTLSKKNLSKAKNLLAGVDESSIPEDKKASFEEFKSKLPLFEKLVNDSVDYSKFLEDFIGTKGTKKYLILFQNPSELRPTGGFPGTYGVISFKDGKLQEFKVDDVYNLDGQLQELVIPPLQLQHITPNWGMRDANWFIDFPTSARKIVQFYQKITSQTCKTAFTSLTCKEIDGVITFSPKIVAQILDIVGPVEMPEYDLILDSKNLFSALQEEVEYKGDRKQPKKIIVDLAPKMLKKLYSAESIKWLDVFNLLVSSMEKKDILMYFRDLNLESFSSEKGFSGQVKNTDSDYLMVTLTNVKGSKTDLVTDTSLKVKTIAPDAPVGAGESGDVKHKVSITRTHNGGNNKYGFYNKQNPAYVRVLVPENAEFTGLTGNSRPNFKPLVEYTDSEFKKDEDLSRFEEESFTDQETGVTIYREAGKTEYGFWMITNPGETKTVDLEYTVPSSGKDYQFYIQKQPGLDIKDFKFYMDNNLYYGGPLDKDMLISPK